MMVGALDERQDRRRGLIEITVGTLCDRGGARWMRREFNDTWKGTKCRGTILLS
jgi:hypothetical protein